MSKTIKTTKTLKILAILVIAITLLSIFSVLATDIQAPEVIKSVSEIENFNYVYVSLTGYRGDKNNETISDTIPIWDEYYNNVTQGGDINDIIQDATFNHIENVYVVATDKSYTVTGDPYNITHVEHCTIAQFEDYNYDWGVGVQFENDGQLENAKYYYGAAIMHYHGYMMIYYWYLYLKNGDVDYVNLAYKEYDDWDLESWFKYAWSTHVDKKTYAHQLWAGHYDFCLDIAHEVNATYWAFQEAPPGAV